ncbi:MAG: uncharacterized protein KVP18_001666 [Porospora cf. gigantea A]|uniref:uncharacterized protein n=1 Tax=Porospora cf. gigantea A TaxID=2853593 RepID=UPI003559B707|nr:MAG: hypothetical protein KVP18_001666 [Porospora cf. gigantea A]
MSAQDAVASENRDSLSIISDSCQLESEKEQLDVSYENNGRQFVVSEQPDSQKQQLIDFFYKYDKDNPLTLEDFDNDNRRRHLESFQNSVVSWSDYDSLRGEGNPIKREDLETFVMDVVSRQPTTEKQLHTTMVELRRKHKIAPSKSQLMTTYWTLVHDGDVVALEGLEAILVRKAVRTTSGVVVITVLTSPGDFSCPKNCHYCPSEPGQPRSYLSTEPAVLRANQNGWDAVEQFYDRALTLLRNGHVIDKIEVLVLGGTWSGYPAQYQEDFVTSLFFAANTFQDMIRIHADEAGDPAYIPENNPGCLRVSGLRQPMSLAEEQQINENTQSKIIGLTLETRPDYINKKEIRRLRKLGCTRVQMGVQHTSDDILRKVNRGHLYRHSARAMRLLKDACFKVDIHLMPDLPGSNPTIDRAMLEDVLSSPDLQADQWKIYPCEVTPFSAIEKWYADGEFMPYAEEDAGQRLIALLLACKVAVHPWIRLNRVVRDIPNQSIIAGNKQTNLRQVLLQSLSHSGLSCRCIRCREVRQAKAGVDDAVMKVRQYYSTGGVEFFLSFETTDELMIFGFLRLRIRDPEDGAPKHHAFPELNDSTALIRELHVYGKLVPTAQDVSQTQHAGLGHRLLAAAEQLSVANGCTRIAVIAGVGTRNYYRKFGYEMLPRDEGQFLFKTLNQPVVDALQVQVYDLTTRFELEPRVLRALYGQEVVLTKKQIKSGVVVEPPLATFTSDAVRSHSVGSYSLLDLPSTERSRPSMAAARMIGWTKSASRRGSSSRRHSADKVPRRRRLTSCDTPRSEGFVSEDKSDMNWGQKLVVGTILLLSAMAVRRWWRR